MNETGSRTVTSQAGALACIWITESGPSSALAGGNHRRPDLSSPASGYRLAAEVRSGQTAFYGWQYAGRV